MTEWKAEDWIALAGEGPVEIVEVLDDGGLVVYSSGNMTLPADEVVRRVRPLVSEDRAQAIRASFDSLGNLELPESDYQRKKVYKKAHRSGDLHDIADALITLYGREEYLYPEQMFLPKLEEQLFEELSRVLEVPKAELKEEAKRAAKQDPGPPPV